ncbi:MAG: nitroreductase [Rhizobiales bacterium]|nr:nitroreductase [Hyphomicrobiales bacterium]
MTSFNDTSSVLSFLKSRKSGSAKAMGPPGPDAAQLAEILGIAVRVPDHGKLTPWRFVIFEGEARTSIGEVFAKRYRELHPSHGEEPLAFQRGLFTRAPTVIGVVSRAAPHPKIPEWEQQMSAAAVAYNIELAAAAMGFQSQWQTDWVAYDREVGKAIGLSETERFAGFVYIGTSTAPLEDRPRPDPQALVTRWSGA